MSHVMNDPIAEQAEVEKRLRKRIELSSFVIGTQAEKINELYAEIKKLREQCHPIAYAHMWEHGFSIHETEEMARAEIAYAFECVEAQGLIEKSPSYLVAVLSVARHAPVMQWSEKL